MSKVALITGITGQDGSYLAEFLLEKGYEVHGITRRASISNTARIDHLIAKNAITLHDGDLSDSSSLIRIIGLVQPDEIYNLAAQSHVQVSFDVPEYSGDVDAIGVLRILEAVRILGLAKKTKVYQASTSELFGKVEEVPQRETTPFHPYSPYAVAKQYGFWIVKEYREAYGMFAVNGILFNHESERRGENFVTRKITLAAGRIAEGIQDHLELGNMDSLRDWGYAKDYVECMWMILQHETPEDFVIATGEQHTVRDFTEKAFAANGITIRWEGTGIDEKGYDAQTGKMLVCVNPQWLCGYGRADWNDKTNAWHHAFSGAHGLHWQSHGNIYYGTWRLWSFNRDRILWKNVTGTHYNAHGSVCHFARHTALCGTGVQSFYCV